MHPIDWQWTLRHPSAGPIITSEPLRSSGLGPIQSSNNGECFGSNKRVFHREPWPVRSEHRICGHHRVREGHLLRIQGAVFIGDPGKRRGQGCSSDNIDIPRFIGHIPTGSRAGVALFELLSGGPEHLGLGSTQLSLHHLSGPMARHRPGLFVRREGVEVRISSRPLHRREGHPS